MTEHVHELRIVRDWSLGIVVRCDVQGCEMTMGLMEANRRLNEYGKLKRATDALSAEDARTASKVWRQKERLNVTLRAYADILEDK